MEDIKCYTNCSKCGQGIKNIVMINNKPYGPDCALVVLGMKSFPVWFKGGDWDKAKIDWDQKTIADKAMWEKYMEYTEGGWGQWIELSKAARKAYAKGDDWACSFMSSILNQLGYSQILPTTQWETMEEARSNWRSAHGDFPIVTREVGKVEDLSPKQLQIVKKILAKY